MRGWYNPFGVGALSAASLPGVRLRRRALSCNAFGVPIEADS